MNTHFTVTFRFVAFTLIFIVQVSRLCAQKKDFVTATSIGDLAKSDSIIAYENAVKRRDQILRLTYVKIGSLAESQRNGILALTLPGSGREIIAKAQNVKYESEDNYEWIGKTDDDRGTVILLSNKGSKLVYISTPAGIWEIEPAPHGVYALKEFDPAKVNEVGCVDQPYEDRDKGLLKATTRTVADSNAASRLDPCTPQTNPRILVLYTPAALAAVGSVAAVQNRALMGITQFNTCLYNSDVQSGAVLTLAGVAPVGKMENGSLGDDLEKLIANAMSMF